VRDPDPGWAAAASVEAGSSGQREALPATEGWPARVRLRSTLGYAPRRAFVARPGDRLGAVAVELDDGRLSAALELPLEVRVPGHRALRIDEPGAWEVEPVLGLVLELHGSWSRVRELAFGGMEVDGLEGGAEAVPQDGAALHLDGERDELSVAVDPERLRGPLVLELHATGPALLRLTLDPAARGTFRHRLELAPLAPGSAIVDVSCGGGPHVVEVGLQARVADDERRAFPESFPWGTLHRHVYDPGRSVRAPAPLVLEELAAGRVYFLNAICREHGRYGRASFVAGEATGVVIPMEPGCRVRGGLQCADPALRVAVDLAEPAADRTRRELRPTWYTELDVATDPEGRFELLLPTRVPTRADAPWPMPTEARLTFLPSVGRRLHRDVRLIPGGAVDLGTLPLELERVVRLWPTPEIAPEDVAYVRYLRGGALVERSVSGVSRTVDPAVATLRLDERPVFGTEAEFVPPNAIVLSDGFQPFAARLDGDAYRVVPHRGCEIGVEASLAERFGYLGWTWRGVPDVFDMASEHPGKGARTLSIRLPEGVEELWAAANRFGPDASGEARRFSPPRPDQEALALTGR